MRLSNSGRVLFGAAHQTKLALVRYYEQIAQWMLPHVVGRPLTLVHCPKGISGECRYMKHSKLWSPPALRRVQIQEKKKVGDYLVIEDLAGLVSLAQMDVLEIHTWNTRIDRVEQPDRIVFDIDPGEQVTWPQVVEAARAVRALLQGLGLASWVKTTGGRGAHVVVPITRQRTWDECLRFSRAVAQRMERERPERYTTAFAKAGRAHKILLDYLRNNRTNTSVAAFSTRANAAATVSTPLRWEELRPSLDPASFTMDKLPHRLQRLRTDPWAGYWQSRQRLTDAMLQEIADPTS